MSEPDSDVVRWGLNFLGADQIFNPHYYGDNNQRDVYVYHEQHNAYNNPDTGCSNVENDEIIAHALQEEFSQLTISEAYESSHAEQPMQASSDTATDWLSSQNYYSGYGGGQVEAEAYDMGPSSPEHKSYDGGEEYYRNLEITDESPLDGEVCKRLNQMIPVPHVPRINGDIPSTDEVISDHQRLLDRRYSYQEISPCGKRYLTRRYRHVISGDIHIRRYCADMAEGIHDISLLFGPDLLYRSGQNLVQT